MPGQTKERILDWLYAPPNVGYVTTDFRPMAMGLFCDAFTAYAKSTDETYLAFFIFSLGFLTVAMLTYKQTTWSNLLNLSTKARLIYPTTKVSVFKLDYL